jgi:hypothetical protein
MAKKRAAGRGSGSGRNKTDNLLVRLSPAEKKGFSDAAELAGIPLSAWVRERLRWAAVKELQAADRQVAFLTDRADDKGAEPDGSDG